MPIRRPTTQPARFHIATLRRREVHRHVDGEDRPTRPADRSTAQAAATLASALVCAAAATITPFPATAAAPAASKSASPSATIPSVRCELHYGGETFTVDATPTADPYRVPAHEIGSYFLFKLVWPAPGQRPGQTVHAYTYADLPHGPTLIHQQSFPAAALSPRQRPHGTTTAWQRVHEPMRDGELLYRCARVEAKANASARTGSVSTTTAPQVSQLHPAPPRPAPAVLASSRPVVPPRIQLPDSHTNDVVKLVFAGDLMLDDGPGRLIARGGDPLAPFAPILAAADVAIGNLETPIAAATTGQPLDRKIYAFRSSPEVMRVLKGRFHALSVANNHSGDYGHPAFLETLTHLSAAGIQAFGGGEHLAQAHAPLWIEQPRTGLKIALLAYNEFKPRSFEAGPHWPGISWSEDDQVIADIHAARRAGAHVVIPFMHWGWEREQTPGPRQRALAHRMLAAGADAIVGGHPHVTQGSSVIRGKPVIWSLGNFVFDGFEKEPAAQVGWVLEMEIDRRGVRRWRTVEARMDGDGTPHPATGALTPSGAR